MKSKNAQLWIEYKADWNRFAKEILNVNLDDAQKKILMSIQNNKKISVRSGHARGKDYVTAVACLCFLYLYYPSKVICTAPTDRQVVSIMMSEIGKIHNGAKIKLPGKVLERKIRFEDNPDWYLIGFKASDTEPEAWTGYHSENIMIAVTEATGIEQQTFDAIEGLLTGNSKLLIVFNPNDNQGEAYKSVKSPYYKKHKLSCLDAPNVLAKKQIYPGQVDYEWVKERVERWCEKVTEDEVNEEYYDFKFNKQWYRPNDLFRIKVLGEFAGESENQVIPLRWIELSNEKWLKAKKPEKSKLRLSVDVAGMGRDETVFVYRYDNYVEKLTKQRIPVSNPAQIHMGIAGKIKTELPHGCKVLLDTIGEGAGVHARLLEQDVESISVKFSEKADRLFDMTGERTFANIRAFCFWAIRDALDPKLEGNLLLPVDEELTEELTEIKIKGLRSDGSILLEPKDDIKKRLGRSPDKADALAISFYPKDKRKPVGSFEVVSREGIKIL